VVLPKIDLLYLEMKSTNDVVGLSWHRFTLHLIMPHYLWRRCRGAIKKPLRMPRPSGRGAGFRLTPVIMIMAMILIFSLGNKLYGEEYQQIAGLIDTRTTFSDGDKSLEELVKLAKKRGFFVLFVNDHDRVVMEYGLYPFRNIFRKRIERASILKTGANKYIEEISRVSRRYPEMIIIPGAESSPFYYWTGSLLHKNLTAHNWEKHLLVVGLETPEDYENLPILHSNFSTRYLGRLLPGTSIFLIPIILGIVMTKWKGSYRLAGITIIILSFLAIINYHPFKSSPFDPYHGDQGILPYQELIDYVNERGGMTFWNHPETGSGIRKLGSIDFRTPPYPDHLLRSQDYTGFAALYGDNITITEPGREWDTHLQGYCMGKRKWPAWGISTGDYHSEKGDPLGTYPTVFLVKNKTKREILDALKRGRMYACRRSLDSRISLDEFSVEDSATGLKGTMGEEVFCKDNPLIKLKISAQDGKKYDIRVRIVRSGQLMHSMEGTTPFEATIEDNSRAPGKNIYYRMDMRGGGAMLVSNPIFVKFAGS